MKKAWWVLEWPHGRRPLLYYVDKQGCPHWSDDDGPAILFRRREDARVARALWDECVNKPRIRKMVFA